MFTYIFMATETALRDKKNMKLVEEIDKEFFSSCLRSSDRDEKLQAALKKLEDAGEGDFVKNIDKYLYTPA